MNAIENLVKRKAAELFPGSPVDQSYFIALAKQESGFDPAAHNTRGEDSFGLFQFGPDMRRAYGMDTKSPVEVQLAAAGDYLKKLHQKHGGDWTSILAEHNLGLPRYNRWKSGKSDAAVDAFLNSHLPSVTAHAKSYGASSTAPAQVAAPTATAAANPASAPLADPFMSRLSAMLAPQQPQQVSRIPEILRALAIANATTQPLFTRRLGR